ncbi:MAG TPA: ABC transporter ATP-binding protein [Polyangiaceae bacterium]|nr:ABC transporter ATP-binding protein [Polyangiaceae bacterium]
MRSVAPEPRPVPTGLWQQFTRNAPRYVAGLGLLAVYQFTQYWFDTRLRQAINAALSHEREQATVFGVKLVLVACLGLIVRVFSRMAIFNAGRIAEYELRRSLSERLLLLGPSFYRRMSTGEIMSRVTNDLGQVRTLLGFGVLNVINTAFALASALAVLIPISPKLTLTALIPLPVLLIVTRRFSHQFFTRMRDNQDSLGRMSARVQSSIAGVRVVRSFALEEKELEAFERGNRDYLDRSLKLAYLRGSFGLILQATIAAGVIVVFWYGGHLVIQKELDPGGFLAFYRALLRLTWPLISLGFVVSLVQRGRASYSRLAEVFRAQPDVFDGELAHPEKLEGRLVVKNLSFSHGERRVLDDVSFELPAGGSLAIVGRTGSGKSTLAVLLARLLPTPRGTVFLDGVDVCDLPLSTVRSVIGYAQQNAFLFSTTAGRNVGFPLDDPDSPESLERIVQAANDARILEEISSLPDGFDTVVGERGVQLSGGQKQRIALAAAFVSQPKILVLDDPLSAVDARTERGILDAIERQSSMRSVVLITHRVAAAALCDRILVLDAGKIVESGTHEELARGGGLYAAFAEEQRIESELEKLGESELSSEAVAQ